MAKPPDNVVKFPFGRRSVRYPPNWTPVDRVAFDRFASYVGREVALAIAEGRVPFNPFNRLPATPDEHAFSERCEAQFEYEKERAKAEQERVNAKAKRSQKKKQKKAKRPKQPPKQRLPAPIPKPPTPTPTPTPPVAKMPYLDLNGIALQIWHASLITRAGGPLLSEELQTAVDALIDPSRRMVDAMISAPHELITVGEAFRAALLEHGGDALVAKIPPVDGES